MDTNQAFDRARQLIKHHGLTGWTVQARRYKTTGGVTYFNTKTIGLSPQLIELWTPEEFEQVVLHEIAHALVGANHGHDEVWRRTAKMIGYTGGRSHSLPTVSARYSVECPNCGVLGERHRKPKGRMVCRLCRSSIVFRDTRAAEAAASAR